MFSTQAYLSVEQKTSIVLDASQEKKLQLNFNVTLYHLPCRFATLDIVDVMGTHFQNVSTNIIKTRVETDAEGRGVSTLGRHAQKPPPPCVAARPPTALHSLLSTHCPLPTAHCPLPHCPLPHCTVHLTAGAVIIDSIIGLRLPWSRLTQTYLPLNISHSAPPLCLLSYGS